MAIEKNITGTFGENYGKYHRVALVKMNYNNMQMDVFVRHYADSSYREAEKAEQESLKADIARIKELEAKETLTEEETKEKEKLVNLQYQESRIVPKRSLPNVQDSKYTLDIAEELDNRETVYQALMKLDEFKKGKEV